MVYIDVFFVSMLKLKKSIFNIHKKLNKFQKKLREINKSAHQFAAKFFT